MSAPTQNISTPPAPPAPWLASDAFPPKPPASAGAGFGYSEQGKLIPCTLEQLQHDLADGGRSSPALVWTPETPHLVPPIEVPSFVDRIRQGERTDAEQAVQRYGLSTIAWLLLWAGQRHLWGFLLVVMLGLLPLLQALYARKQARLLTPEQALREVPAARFEVWLTLRRPWITHILLAGLVLIGIAQLFLGLPNTILVAGLVKPAVSAGQFWRLLTATMLHGGVLHLLFNAGALITLGRQFELLTNRRLFLIVYTLSALGGSLTSYLLLPHVTSVGASGAIMGLLGALVCLAIRARRILPDGYLRSLLLNVGMIAVLGAIGFTMIDNAAHFGGLLVGFLCVFALVRRPSTIPIPPTPLHRHLAVACATLLTLAFLLTLTLILLFH